jgi:hypothetical protein
VSEPVLSSTSNPSRIGSVRSERARWVPPNSTLDRTAGSHALAAAGQRERAPMRAAVAALQWGDPGWLHSP